MSGPSVAYAVALFELAMETAETDAVDAALSSFVENIDIKTTRFFMHPNIRKTEKKAVLSDVKPSVFRDFLFVVIDNNRFNALSPIKARYRILHEAKQRTMPIRVTSKTALSKERKDALKEEFEKKYNVTVELENIVDATLLGGLKFEYRGLVVDHTVNERLAQLKATLKT